MLYKIKACAVRLGQRAVSRRVFEDEQEAVRCHLNISREDKHHSSLIHITLRETTSDVRTWQSRIRGRGGEKFKELKMK